MLQIVKPFISVRIDVAADSSDMAIILPTLQFLDKFAFRIFHNKPNSLSASLEMPALKVDTINPLITNL